jgi:hypothetical protein
MPIEAREKILCKDVGEDAAAVFLNHLAATPQPTKLSTSAGWQMVRLIGSVREISCGTKTKSVRPPRLAGT